MAEQSGKPRRASWARRLLIWVGGAIVLLVLVAGAGVLVAKYWVIPSMVRGAIQAALADVWQGQAELRTLEFSFLSPPRAGGLELYGPGGRPWVRTGDIRLEMRDWPGMHPYVTSVEVEGVQIILHMSEGEVRLPIRQPAPKDESDTGEGYLDLRSIRLKDISLAVVDDETGRRSHWRGIELTVTRRAGGESYDVALQHTPEGGQAARILTGTVRGDDLQADLRLRLDGRITETNTGMLLTLLNVTGIRELAGQVRTDLAVTGRLDKPSALEATGSLVLDKWHASGKEGRVVDELSVEAALKGRSGTLAGRVKTPAWSAEVADAQMSYVLVPLELNAHVNQGAVEIGLAGDYGPFWGKLLGDNVIRGRSDVAGDVSYAPARARALDFEVVGSPQLQELIIAGQKEHVLRNVRTGQVRFGPTRALVSGLAADYIKGKLQVDADAWLGGEPGRTPALADWGDLNRIHAAAKVALDNIDTMAIPFLPELIGLTSPGAERFGLSDAAAVVTLERSIFTFQSGRLANPISAMEVEKGGTINVATKRLDFAVIAVPLHLLRSILTKIPLLNLAVDFKDKLVRFVVRGPWSDPPHKLIGKEPVKDIAQGTVDFFKGVVETGGELVPALLKGVVDIFTLPAKLLPPPK